MIYGMRVLFFVLVATVLEATGDAVVRVALTHPSLPARLGLFAAGTLLLGRDFVAPHDDQTAAGGSNGRRGGGSKRTRPTSDF